MTKQHDSKKQQAPYNFHTGVYKFLSGATIGLINATTVTPIVNYTNHAINRNTNPSKDMIKFTCARAFDGVISYNISFILRISLALLFNSWFIHKLEQLCEVNDTDKLLSSILGGGIGGSAATVPEAIAQTQQLSKYKPTPITIIKEAYKANGLFGLSRGMQATMVRSAGVTAGALGLMPMLGQRIRQEIGDHPIADIFSAMVCGLIVGPITTLPNALRFSMQKNFTIKGPAPTYTQLVKDAYRSNEGLRNLFVGIKPRTLMSVISMYIIAEGNKLCNLYSTDGFPRISGPGFK